MKLHICHPCNILLVWSCLGATVTAISTSAYTIVERSQQASPSSWSYEDEANISFDGDVAAIQELALQKAAMLANEGGRNPSSQPEIPVTCDTSTAESVMSLQFDYAVEYDPFYDANVGAGRLLQATAPTVIIEGIERELQTRLSRILLICESNEKHVLEANILGLVRSTEGGLLEDRTCAPEDPQNVCAPHFGKMTLFLAEEKEEDSTEWREATYLVLSNIQREIEDPSLVSKVGQGLVKVTFLGPAPMEPTPSGSTSDSRSPITAAVVTVGAALIVLFLTGLFVWKRSSKRNVVLLEDEAESSIRRLPSASDDENLHPSSQFSEMLPSAYRYNENMSTYSDQMGLSAVSEVTDEDSSARTKSPEGVPPGISEHGNPPSSLLVQTGSSVTGPVYNPGPSYRADHEGDGGQEDDLSDVSSSPKGKSNGNPAAIGSLLEIASPRRQNNFSYPTSDDDDDLLLLA